MMERLPNSLAPPDQGCRNEGPLPKDSLTHPQRTSASARTALTLLTLLFIAVLGVISPQDHAQPLSLTRLSQDSAGNPGNGNSESYPSAAYHTSADGQFVVFTSDASNLVTGDTNDRSDIFLAGTATGELT